MDDRAPSCNIIPHDLWIKFQRSSANYLRIFYHSHVLQIHHVDWPTGSFSRMSCYPILTATQIYKHGDYVWTALSISWYTVSTRCATIVLPAAIRIHHLKNFDSELQLINANLAELPISFSGWGEKLLEINNNLGHNLRQYGMYVQKQYWTFCMCEAMPNTWYHVSILFLNMHFILEY